MTELLSTPLPHALQAASVRLRMAGEANREQSVQSLDLTALAMRPGLQRDAVLDAQSALRRGAQSLDALFAQALDVRLRAEWFPRGAATLDLPSSWDELSLVDDRELDSQVAAERFGMAIAHGCEWELRELDGYLRALTQRRDAGDPAARRNVLRPENVGYAVIKAVDSLKLPADVRKVAESELARSWAATLPKVYAGIVAEMRMEGLTPVAMSIRGADRSPGASPSASAPLDTTRRGMPGTHDAAAARGAARSRWDRAEGGPSTQASSTQDMQRGRYPPAAESGADPGLTSLLRRLSEAVMTLPAPPSASMELGGMGAHGSLATGAALPNLIHTHRAELLQVAKGSMDHMVIDVIGHLFDQILSDPKVPPQIAREIGRLQLPVLRTAMADASFFASRRHPVRRLVNRMASLGVALDDLDSPSGRALVEQIQQLVRSIVDGDFEQLQLYEAKLEELERFVAEQGLREVEQQGQAAKLLAEREVDSRSQQHSARRLKSELQPLQAPDFVREFIAETWTEVLVRHARLQGRQSEIVQQSKQVAHDLFMSVQPKGTPAQRQEFLARLPRLMQDLNRGMDLIAWPDEARNAFFGQLLPAHAQSLKGEGLRTLDFNLLSRQIDQVMDSALPRADEPGVLSGSQPGALDTEQAALLTPQEAQSVGLLAEDKVDWQGPLDIDLSQEPTVGPGDLAIRGMPEPEAPEPTRGRSLADHVQIGFAYQMHLEGQWHKVRLTHISPGRSFYVFSRGTRHQQVISLTHRMLLRMCEAERLRAFESAYLLERATARARRQLAAIRPAAGA